MTNNKSNKKLVSRMKHIINEFEPHFDEIDSSNSSNGKLSLRIGNNNFSLNYQVEGHKNFTLYDHQREDTVHSGTVVKSFMLQESIQTSIQQVRTKYK